MTSLSDRAGFLIVANLIKYAVGFIMPMVLVRMLSQTEYGTYQQMILISTTTIGIMTLGLPTSIYYFYHHTEPGRLPALFVQTTLMLLAAGIVATAGVFLGASHLAAGINNASMTNLLQLFAVSLVFMVASEHSIPFMIAQNRYSSAVMFEVGETVVRVLTLLVPLWLGFGFTGLIASMVFYGLLRFAARGGYLFRTSGLDFSGWSKNTFMLSQLGYSIPIAMMALSGLLGNSFNRGILAASFTPRDYAIYSVGALEIPLDVIFQASVANVLRASLPPLVREGNLKEVTRIVCEAVRKLSIIVLPSFIFLLGHAEQFITTLFTNSYQESVSIFRIYLWVVPLHMFILSPIPQTFGKTRTNMYIVMGVVAYLVASSWILLKTVGFYGPAYAAVSCQWVAVVAYFVVVLRLTHSTLRQLLPIPHIARVVAVSLVGLAAAYPVRNLTHSGLFNLLLAAVVYSVVFLGLAAVTGIFTGQDRQLMRRWAAKVLPISAV